MLIAPKCVLIDDSILTKSKQSWSGYSLCHLNEVSKEVKTKKVNKLIVLSIFLEESLWKKQQCIPKLKCVHFITCCDRKVQCTITHIEQHYKITKYIQHIYCPSHAYSGPTRTFISIYTFIHSLPISIVNLLMAFYLKQLYQNYWNDHSPFSLTSLNRYKSRRFSSMEIRIVAYTTLSRVLFCFLFITIHWAWQTAVYDWDALIFFLDFRFNFRCYDARVCVFCVYFILIHSLFINLDAWEKKIQHKHTEFFSSSFSFWSFVLIEGQNINKYSTFV